MLPTTLRVLGTADCKGTPSLHQDVTVHPLVRRFVMIGLALVALGLIVYAAMDSSGGLDNASLSKPPYVLRLEPQSGSEVLTQATVGIEVKTGYDAYLDINGVTIRNVVDTADGDGLKKIPMNGLYITYTPGPGRKVPKLKPEKNIVTAFVYKSEDGPASALPFQWSFDAA